MISVKRKIVIARVLNGTLRFLRRLGGRGMQVQCRRRGVNWALDLNEGIDLSIYLLGAYEPGALRTYERIIARGNVVFDIGANIGAHTLHFARLVGPAGRVHAFEPTDFAVAKLRTNLERNPALVSGVTVQQSFLVAEGSDLPPGNIPSSWPLTNDRLGLEPDHGGRPQTLRDATTITLDDYCETAGVERIDFVKIDVDGYEFPVLQGFQRSLRRFRPVILIELAPFVFEGETAGEFDALVNFLRDLGYAFKDSRTGAELPGDPAGLRRMISAGAAVNALLTPQAGEPGERP